MVFIIRSLNSYCDSCRERAPNDLHSTIDFAVFLGLTSMSWSAKKQHVAHSSAGAE